MDDDCDTATLRLGHDTEEQLGYVLTNRQLMSRRPPINLKNKH